MNDLIEAIAKTFGKAPDVVVGGQRWVKLPDCDGCRSFRWDVEEKRFYHDPNCVRARK